MKFAAVLVALAASASAFKAPTTVVRGVTMHGAPNSATDGGAPNTGEGKEGAGAGGMFDTRDPEPFVNESDPRQSISQAPSFEEYLKSRS